MTLPTLSAPVTTLVTTQTFSVNLPAGTAEKMVVVTIDGGGLSEDIPAPSGWTRIGLWWGPAPANGATTGIVLAVFRSNGETAATSISLTTSTKAELGATAAYTVTDGDFSSLVTGTAVGGTGTTMDAPSVALDGGDGLVIALMGRADGVDPVATFPSGYTYRTDQWKDDQGSGALGGLAAKQVSSGASDDPGAFTVTVGEDWVTQTLFLPGAAASTVDATAAQTLPALTQAAGAKVIDPAGFTVDITGTTITYTSSPSPTPGVTEYAVCRRVGTSGTPLHPVTDRVALVDAATFEASGYTENSVPEDDYDFQVFGGY